MRALDSVAYSILYICLYLQGEEQWNRAQLFMKHGQGKKKSPRDECIGYTSVSVPLHPQPVSHFCCRDILVRVTQTYSVLISFSYSILSVISFVCVSQLGLIVMVTQQRETRNRCINSDTEIPSLLTTANQRHPRIGVAES